VIPVAQSPFTHLKLFGTRSSSKNPFAIPVVKDHFGFKKYVMVPIKEIHLIRIAFLEFALKPGVWVF